MSIRKFQRRTGEAQWKEVHKDSPCPICGKTDWCSVSTDGNLAACRRESKGAISVKTDKSSVEYYLHRIGLPSVYIGKPHVNGVNKFQPAEGDAKPVSRADPAILHNAYQVLLTNLGLSDLHRGALKARGLSEDEIAKRGYRSYPRNGRSALAKRLREELGDKFSSIPGFVIASEYPKLVGPDGLLIPCRDVASRIVALKVRRDGSPSGNKYVYFSSTGYDGPGPGAPVHVPLGIQSPVTTVRLTEGEFKADIATAVSGLATISLPGVAGWRAGLPILHELGAKTVRLAFDADAATNKAVAKAQLDCAQALLVEGFSLEFERWDLSVAKGIDDLLASGKKPELLVGEAALSAIKDVARTTGVVSADTGASETKVRLNSLLEGGGPAAIFADQPMLEKLASLSENNPPELAILRDFLRSRKVNLTDLQKLLKPHVREARSKESAVSPTECESYFISEDSCICREKQTPDGPVSVQLANFEARIVEQVTHDDGAEQRTLLSIEGSMAGGQSLPQIQVTAEEFPRMNWPIQHWGVNAVVSAGMSAKDHTRAAIQILSPKVARRVEYAHTGWRQIDGRSVYLHAGGAIGPDGADSSIAVALPDALAGYRLPLPPTNEDFRKSVQASLRMLDVAKRGITFPLLAAVYRSVLGDVDFGLFLVGPTGVFKSELSALGQQHFGPELDARHFPGSWSSTANALEATAFAVKDAVMVVDDFAPGGATNDIQRLHRDADRLLRAQGNHSGRQRMRADGSLRAPKPPRGLIISTGEDLPRGQSLRARLMVNEIGPGDVNLRQLSICQEDARSGLYAQSMAGFIHWLAPKYDAVRRDLRNEVIHLRDSAIGGGQHARTPGIVADLAIGLKYFLAFAVQVRVLSQQESEGLWQEGWNCICGAARDQQSHQQASEPTAHLLRLLSAALASGRAHVAGPDGDCPETSPEAWGWKKVDNSQPRAQGHRIGWVNGEDLFLEPEASFAEAQRLATEQGESLAITPRTMHKRLKEKKLLLSEDETRKTITIRKTLEGIRHSVLHLHAASITGETLTKLTNATVVEENVEGNGQFAGQVDGQVLSNPTSNLTTKTDRFNGNGDVMVSLVSRNAGGDGFMQPDVSSSEHFEEGEV